jgi:hypothetical protein
MIRIIKENGANKAFWFKNGNLLEVDENHIKEVIENPELFGITKEEIEEIYRKYNEPIGLEGKAREEIIRLTSKSGWIRIRHYRTPNDYWSIQFNTWIQARKQVKKFVEYALENLGMYPVEAIKLLGYEDSYQIFYSTPEGGAKNLLEGIK